MDETQNVKQPPNCGHDPNQLTLSRFFRDGYTEDHEHLLICKICEREAMDEFYRKETIDESNL